MVISVNLVIQCYSRIYCGMAADSAAVAVLPYLLSAKPHEILTIDPVLRSHSVCRLVTHH